MLDREVNEAHAQTRCSSEFILLRTSRLASRSILQIQHFLFTLFIYCGGMLGPEAVSRF
jgi:hypothetical protein